VIWWHCWIAEWALRNPNWWWGIQSLFENSGSILRSISFSSNFARIGGKLIGRYDFTSLGTLTVPCIKIISTSINE
jgi:hypothetical protein